MRFQAVIAALGILARPALIDVTACTQEIKFLTGWIPDDCG